MKHHRYAAQWSSLSIHQCAWSDSWSICRPGLARLTPSTRPEKDRPPGNVPNVLERDSGSTLNRFVTAQPTRPPRIALRKVPVVGTNGSRSPHRSVCGEAALCRRPIMITSPGPMQLQLVPGSNGCVVIDTRTTVTWLVTRLVTDSIGGATIASFKMETGSRDATKRMQQIVSSSTQSFKGTVESISNHNLTIRSYRSNTTVPSTSASQKYLPVSTGRSWSGASQTKL